MLLPSWMSCPDNAASTMPEAGTVEVIRPGTRQTTAEIPGVGTVRYTISVPAGYDGASPVPLVLVLHYGYGGSRPDPYTGGELLEQFRPALARLGAVVIAPDALGGDWTSRINEQAAVWLTASAKNTYHIDPKRVLVTGYSMGGAGAWYLGGRHSDLFTGAIVVSGPPEDLGQWKIPVAVIHSDTDQVVPFEQAMRQVQAVRARGVPVQFLHASTIDHYDTAAFAPYLGAAASWMNERWTAGG